jgi:hypothetical protein
MVARLRRGLGSLSAWAALFAVAGVAYAVRRRSTGATDAVTAESPDVAN